MISYLKGKVKQKSDRGVLVVVNNIGYQVLVPEYLLAKIKIDQDLELFTHLHITRDETMELFGLPNYEELKFFELLITISGVGRRSALGALSVARVSELKKTISRGDSALLQKVAGIGKKTAERIVVELKDKLLPGSQSDNISNLDGSDVEVITALENLGYKINDIREVLRQLPEDLKSSEAKVKAVLKMLGKK